MLTGKQGELHAGPRGLLKAVLILRKQRVELEMRYVVNDVDSARKRPILQGKTKRPAVLNADDSVMKMHDEPRRSDRRKKNNNDCKRKRRHKEPNVGACVENRKQSLPQNKSKMKRLVELPNANAVGATQSGLLEVQKRRKVVSDEVSNLQTNITSGDPIVAKRDRKLQLGLILGLHHGSRNTLTHPLLLTSVTGVKQMVDRPRTRWQDVKLVELIDRNTRKSPQKRPKIGEGDEQGETIVSAVVEIENVTEIGARKVATSDITAVERQPLWRQQQHLAQVGGRRLLDEE